MQRLAIFAVAVPAVSIALTTGQPGVALTYIAPLSVTRNEPVVIRVAIQNLLNESVNLDLGWNRREGFALKVRGPGGRVSQPRIVPQGVGRAGRISIPPAEQHVQLIVLDDWLTLDEPGDYEVEIRLTGPIRSSAGRILDSPLRRVSICTSGRGTRPSSKPNASS